MFTFSMLYFAIASWAILGQHIGDDCQFGVRTNFDGFLLHIIALTIPVS